MTIVGNEEEPLVSVWMVTYNHENYIRQSLESVLMQKTAFQFEIIIGEDCSTDGTRVIIEELEKQHPTIIKPIYHERNVGAMRNGYEFCAPKLRGKYVACLEGDDYWTDPYKLQKQVDLLEAYPEYAISFHRAIIINEVTKEKRNSNQKQKEVSTIEDLFVENFICTASCLFRNGHFQKHIDFFYQYMAGDWVLHIFNAVNGKIHFMKDVMAVYRIHEGGTIFNAVSSTEKLKIAFLQDIYTFKAIDKYFNYTYQHLIKKTLSRFYKQMAVLNIQNNSREEAIANAISSSKQAFSFFTSFYLWFLILSPFPANTYRVINTFTSKLKSYLN